MFSPDLTTGETDRMSLQKADPPYANEKENLLTFAQKNPPAKKESSLVIRLRHLPARKNLPKHSHLLVRCLNPRLAAGSVTAV